MTCGHAMCKSKRVEMTWTTPSSMWTPSQVGRRSECTRHSGTNPFPAVGVYVQTYWFGVFAMRGLEFYPPLVFLKGLRGYLRWLRLAAPTYCYWRYCVTCCAWVGVLGGEIKRQGIYVSPLPVFLEPAIARLPRRSPPCERPSRYWPGPSDTNMVANGCRRHSVTVPSRRRIQGP